MFYITVGIFMINKQGTGFKKTSLGKVPGPPRPKKMLKKMMKIPASVSSTFGFIPKFKGA